MTQTRLQAYAPNGAKLGPLPMPTTLSASFVHNDVGALTFTYDPKAPLANLLGQPLEVAVEVTTDGGATWAEPPKGRFLYLRDGRDAVKRDGYQCEAPGYLQRFTKAVVPFTGLDTDLRRTFSAVKPGVILNTLFTEAQARGALQGLTWTFTTTTDSAGVAWPTNWSVSYEPGKDFLSILRELADLGLIDFQTIGRALQVYVADSTFGLGANLTTAADPVVLRFGRDLTEAPFRRTWENLADTALVSGDQGKGITRTAVAALKPWGRQEAFISAGGVSDDGTLAVIGDASLALTSTERAEYTYGVDFGRAKFQPFTHYAPGAYVWVATSGTTPLTTDKVPQGKDTPTGAVRIRQVTLTRDNAGAVSGNLVVNDRFSEADVRQQRIIQALTNGGTVVTGNGSTTPPGPDILAPAKVAGLLVGSSAYLDSAGQVRAQVSLDWNDTTTNADGSPMADLSRYEVQSGQGSTWTTVAITTASVAYLSPYDPGGSFTFRVRAIDTVGNEGAWSNETSVVTASDAVPPSAPSAPTLTSRLGVLQVNWAGGNGTNGGPLEADTALVRVYVSTASNFTTYDATTFRGTVPVRGGSLAVTGMPTGVPLYVKLRAMDYSGNQGAASSQATHTIASLVDVSNFPDDAMTLLFARTGKFLELTADNFSSNVITADYIDLGSLDGEVVTGLTLRTADPSLGGEAVVIRNDGSGGVIETYSGFVGEVPGVLDPSSTSRLVGSTPTPFPALTVRPGRAGAGGSGGRPTLKMAAGPVVGGLAEASGYVSLDADEIRLNATGTPTVSGEHGGRMTGRWYVQDVVDSGGNQWRTVSGTGGFQPYGGGFIGPRFRRVGMRCEMEGLIVNSLFGGSNVPAGNPIAVTGGDLPVGWLPAGTHVAHGVVSRPGIGDQTLRLDINPVPSGGGNSVQITCLVALPANSYVSLWGLYWWASTPEGA